MKIFSGSSNQDLAQKIVTEKGIRLGKIELSRFSNDECRVRVREKINNTPVAVLQSLSIPVERHIVEFCLICDALKRLGASKITAIIPWLGYSKQDKVFRDGEPLSVKVIAKIIQTAPFDRLITFDLHNKAIVGFFDKPVVELSAYPLFLKRFKKIIDKNTIVVAPDAGAIKFSTEFAHQLGCDVAYIDKKRDLVTGKVTIKGISSQVRGKKTIMIDDLIVTGGTLVEAARFLKKKGVLKVFAAATHHLHLKGVQTKLDKYIDKIIISDTVAPAGKLNSNKLKTLSVSGLIAQAIKE